jgi:hypothetical protein
MATIDAQKFLLRFCEEFRQQRSVIADTEKCWIEDYKVWLEKETNYTIPMPQTEFVPTLNVWMRMTEEGKAAKDSRQVAIISNRVVYAEVRASITTEFDDKWQDK